MIRVLTPGLFTTVQDLGREGYGPLGVSASGAADPIGLRIGNELLGNSANTAALEMTLLGGSFVFEHEAVISLTGSDFGSTLDSSPVALWEAHQVHAGQLLRCGPTRSGARCYLSVRGGIDVPLFLDSASTHAVSGLGGFNGRALKKGDVLSVRTARGELRSLRVDTDSLARLQPRKTLRVTQGPQSEWFSESDWGTLTKSTYRVSEDSNRMAVRLQGPLLASQSAGEMITEGVSLGAIQIPPRGQPIILFVELQTTGGYPKIANIISADLASVGQLRPRDEIHFERVTPQQARRLICEQQQILQSLVRPR
jgi:antagonist of KipI